MVTALLIATLSSAQQSRPQQHNNDDRPAPVRIASPRPNYTFPDGRSYIYSVEWHLITAGTAVIKMDGAGNERKVTGQPILRSR